MIGPGGSRTGGARLRVAVAEDSAILRDGLVELLRAREIEVPVAVGEVAALESALRTTEVDVVVLDVRMPPTHTDEGIRAAEMLRVTAPEVGVLVFSQYVETSYATRLLADEPAGVGYLLKDRVADVAAFVDALRRVAAGETVLDPEVVRHLMAPSRRNAALAGLTPRELEVLGLMAEGYSNAAIAERAHLSLGGVEKNIASIFQRLRLDPSAAAHRRVLAVLAFLDGER